MNKILKIILNVILFASFLLPVNVSLAVENDMGINFSDGCLTGVGQGCLDYEELIGIENSTNENKTVLTIAQDVVLAVTYSVGTLLTCACIYCGIMYIMASNEGKVKDMKKKMIHAFVGAILIRGAYAIVRLIQYIAQG